LHGAVSTEKGLEVFGLLTPDGRLVRVKGLAISTAQGTLDLMGGAVNILDGFVKAPIVSGVSTKLSPYCQLGPPLILHVSKLSLEFAAGKAEGSFLHRARWMSKMRLVS
jgi:hypothetical protein